MIAAAELIAAGHELETRAADPERDRVDGVLPGLVVTPKTGQAVAATLQWAAAHGLSAVIRGHGSKAGWGAVPAAIDLLIDMSGLNRILAHEAGDLTVTVEAGIGLDQLNHALAAHGQWLALDPPLADRATIGGLLATNESGPQRHRFGTPRDLVIGIQLATTDGRLAKAGGQVVKNVAGYDLSKMVSGSFGSLAAIVTATFKLAPLPQASATVVIDRLGLDGLAAVVETVSASQLEPVAFDVDVRQPPGGAPPEIACLIRFASFATVVEAEVANASARIAGFHQSFRAIAGEPERDVWAAHGPGRWGASGTIVRAAWRPSEIRRAVAALIDVTGPQGFELAGRLGVGAGHIRLGGGAGDQRAAVEGLRRSEVFGNVVVAHGPIELKTTDFVWGPRPNGALIAALKRELDPSGVLGAGRGPA